MSARGGCCTGSRQRSRCCCSSPAPGSPPSRPRPFRPPPARASAASSPSAPLPSSLLSSLLASSLSSLLPPSLSPPPSSLPWWQGGLGVARALACPDTHVGLARAAAAVGRSGPLLLYGCANLTDLPPAADWARLWPGEAAARAEWRHVDLDGLAATLNRLPKTASGQGGGHGFGRGVGDGVRDDGDALTDYDPSAE